MPGILVVFGTTDGHTERVAHAIAERLRCRGCAATVYAAREAPDPSAYDAIVVAASVHAGGYQRSIVRWVSKYATALNRIPSAFVSVCLGVLQHDPKVDQDLQRIRTAFLRTTRWLPADTKIVAGALKYTRYNIVKRWIMKRIVTKAGGDTDTSRDYEYTDWNDLAQFADAFSRRLPTDACIRTA